jgi:hypothetical protein
MPTHRYPVVLVRDPAGGYTATAVGEESLAAFGIRQVRRPAATEVLRCPT